MSKVTHDEKSSLYARQQILEYMHLWPAAKSARYCKPEIWNYWVSKQLNPLYVAMRQRLFAGIDFKNKKFVAELGKDARKFVNRGKVIAECDELIEMYETTIAEKMPIAKYDKDVNNYDSSFTLNDTTILRVLIGGLYFARGYFEFMQNKHDWSTKANYTSTFGWFHKSLDYFASPYCIIFMYLNLYPEISFKSSGSRKIQMELTQSLSTMLEIMDSQSSNVKLFSKSEIEYFARERETIVDLRSTNDSGGCVVL